MCDLDIDIEILLGTTFVLCINISLLGTMSTLEALLQIGREFGHEGANLQAFVKKEQDDQREQRRLEREHEKLKFEAAEAERKYKTEVEQLKLNDAEAKRLHDVAIADSQQQHEAYIEKLRIEAEERERRVYADVEKSRLVQQQIEELKAELSQKKLDLDRERLEANKLTSVVKSKLPAFNEDKDKFDAYLNRFESYAALRKWPIEDWAIQLSILLSGKALDTYYGLSSEDQVDYEKVKEALLRRYEFTEDEFRRQFFSAKAESGETPSQFMVRLERVLSRWIQTSKIENSFVALCSLLTREQFIRKCHPELAAYLREKKVQELRELSKATELYLDAHGGSMYEHKAAKKKVTSGNGSTKKVEANVETKVQSETKFCKYCRKAGHDISECKKLLDKANRKCFICASSDHIASECPDRQVSAGFLKYGRRESCIESAEQICRKNGIPVGEGVVNGHKVKFMRDQGSTMVIVNSQFVPSSQYLNKKVHCTLVDGTTHSYPVATIHVDTEYLKGFVDAAVMDSPLFDLVIGNMSMLDVRSSGMEGRDDSSSSVQMVVNTDSDSVIFSGFQEFLSVKVADKTVPVERAGHVLVPVEDTGKVVDSEEKGSSSDNFVVDTDCQLFDGVSVSHKAVISPVGESGEFISEVVLPVCESSETLSMVVSSSAEADDLVSLGTKVSDLDTVSTKIVDSVELLDSNVAFPVIETGVNLIEPIKDVGCISPIIVHETVFNSPDVEAEIDGSVVGNIGVSNVADANYVNVKSVHIDP